METFTRLELAQHPQRAWEVLNFHFRKTLIDDSQLIESSRNPSNVNTNQHRLTHKTWTEKKSIQNESIIHDDVKF